MAASANRTNRNRGPAPRRNPQRYNVTAAAPNGARPTDPPRNMRRYGEAPNGAMAALPPQRNHQNPARNGVRRLPTRTNQYNTVTGAVIPVDPRDVIMDRIEYEHYYARDGQRDEEQYRDAVSMLITAFKDYTNDNYAGHRVTWRTMDISLVDNAIRMFFNDYQGDRPLNVNERLNSLLEQIRRKFNLN